MPNWPLEGGVTGIVSVDRNLRGILRRGGEVALVATAALTEAKAKELFPQLPAKASRRLIVGQLNAAGEAAQGEGFTSSRPGAGEFLIKFTTELATNALCIAGRTGAGTFGFTAISIANKKEVKVEVRNAAGVLANEAFNFYIFG